MSVKKIDKVMCFTLLVDLYIALETELGSKLIVGLSTNSDGNASKRVIYREKLENDIDLDSVNMGVNGITEVLSYPSRSCDCLKFRKFSATSFGFNIEA